MTIVIYVDRAESWYTPYAVRLEKSLTLLGHQAVLAHKPKDVPKGDICFLLSCVRIAKEPLLKKNKANFVIHASALPQGRGFSPLAYQISEGASEIPLTMIEVAEDVDAGDIVMTSSVKFDGHELLDELRTILAAGIEHMVLDYVKDPSPFAPRAQVGEPTWYPRRSDRDDELDLAASLASQFDKLRVVDNTTYPAWFRHRGHKYVVTIHKEES